MWSATTIIVAYIVGHLISVIVAPRLVRLASRTKGEWDDVVIGEIKRRVPWWSVLVGGWLALGYWPALGANEAWLNFAHKALFALGGVSDTLMFISMASRLATVYGATVAPGVPVTGLTKNLLTIFIGLMGGLVILNGLGIEITPMLTALGVGGLAVALALQEPLGNLFAGFFLSMAGHIKVGDFVRLEDGLEGYVADFSWRSARIRQLANNIIIVPNAKLSQATVLNFHLPESELAVVVQAGVDYDCDLAHVERVTIEVATGVMKEVDGGVPAFSPFIRYHTFADSSINFSVIMRGKEFGSQFLVTHEFIKRLHARYAQEGITIPFPQRVVSTREPLPFTQVAGTRPPASRAE
jgi:small-conductance mechanosensitive channel